MSDVYNRNPGAMHGVSQIRGHISYNRPLGPSSADVKRTQSRHVSASKTPEVPLHQGQMRRAWTALSHSLVQQCFNEMTKCMFSGTGIAVYQGSEPKTPSDMFQTILQRDFGTFARDALDCIMAFGIVPIAFRKPASGGLGEDDLVPYVPKYGSYTISTYSESGIQKFRFYWTGALPLSGNDDVTAMWVGGGVGPFGDADDSVMVAHDFGFDPNLDGTLRSNLHAIAARLAFIGEMTNLAVTAERIAANPPIITAYNPAIDDRADDHFRENFFVGNPDRCQNRAQITYERNAQQQKQFRDSMRVWEAYSGLSATAEFGADAAQPRRGENQNVRTRAHCVFGSLRSPNLLTIFAGRGNCARMGTRLERR